MVFFKGDKHRELIDHLSTAGTIGLNLVSATFIGLAMGWFLDKWLGTKPWMLLIMLLFGIAAGFRNVVQEVQRIQRTDKKKDQGATRVEDDEDAE